MSTKNQNEKLMPLLAIAVLVILAFMLILKGGSFTKNSSNQIVRIENANDLDAVAKDLDSENLNQIDSTVNQLNNDSSAF